jgi:hypothetical protein
MCPQRGCFTRAIVVKEASSFSLFTLQDKLLAIDGSDICMEFVRAILVFVEYRTQKLHRKEKALRLSAEMQDATEKGTKDRNDIHD